MFSFCAVKTETWPLSSAAWLAPCGILDLSSVFRMFQLTQLRLSQTNTGMRARGLPLVLAVLLVCFASFGLGGTVAEAQNAPQSAPGPERSPGAPASDTADAPGKRGPRGVTKARQASKEASSAATNQRRRRRGKQSRPRRRKTPNGRVVYPSQLRPEPAPAPSGNVYLFDIARKESIKINIFRSDNSYDTPAIEAVSHVFRCKRTGAEKEIEPRLMAILSHVYDKFGRRIEIVSGYRNQRRTTSYHFKGSAADIRVPGVPIKRLYRFLNSLDSGGMGIGIYPRGNFVHVDVRPPPSYRWVDYARPNPRSRDKQPPRGWRRKLRS